MHEPQRTATQPSRRAGEPPHLSIVVPVYQEEDNVRPLVEAVRTALVGQPAWELLLVDDGSRDRTAEIAAACEAEDPRVRLVRLARNYGQTQAMQAGFDEALGEVVVSMDGDLQNDPRDIPVLLARLEEGFDLVAGYRVRRQDKLITRKVPSWVANRLIRAITKVDIRDNGCSLKAYRRWILDRMSLYSDMHRFLPAMAAATAGARITEIPVRHHPRVHGASKYGLSRIFKILADLLTITLISWFRDHPLRLFAFGAVASFVIGIAFGLGELLALTDVREEMADAYVFPTAALLFLLLSGYLMLLGLITEVATRSVRGEGPELLPLAAEKDR
ncbi:MAG: glycosyltransferase family 2 protein [Gemmatimonadota bacterium]|nr:glycosyltransferase family 2 protein [Gemmatimonadota bacterium]